MRLYFLALAPAAAMLAFGCSSNNGDPDPTPMCTNISGDIDVGGVGVRKPEEDAVGCKEIDNPQAGGPPTVCSEAEPDLSCVAANEPLGTPIEVTFTGCVASFGLEAQSDDLTVTVLRERRPSNNMPTDPGYDLDGVPAMQVENTPESFIEKTVSTLVDSSVCSDLGSFSVAGVPTETPLIVRVTDQHLDKDDRKYIDTYQYNIILRNSMIRSGPNADSPLVADPAATCTMPSACFVVDEVNTVFLTTFRSVALAAGVSFIPGQDDLYDGSGEGHVAGEVQDCSSVDRIQNAVVGLDTDVRKLAYFNVGFPPDPDSLEDPKVEGTRQRTNADGLYAAIGVSVPEGGKAVVVGTAATPSVCGADGVCQCNADGTKNPAWTAADTGEGEAKALGSRTIFVYPDSITILTFDRNSYTVQ